jgi:hypothetical protein
LQSKAHYYAKCKELAAAEKAAASPGDDPKAADKVMQGGRGEGVVWFPAVFPEWKIVIALV